MPEFKLNITANVVDNLKIEPGLRIYFRDVQEYPVTQIVTFTNLDSESFEILSSSTNKPFVQTIVKAIEKGKIYQIEITLTEHSAPPRRSEISVINLKTNSSLCPNTEIIVTSIPAKTYMEGEQKKLR